MESVDLLGSQFSFPVAVTLHVVSSTTDLDLKIEIYDKYIYDKYYESNIEPEVKVVLQLQNTPGTLSL